MSRNSCSSVLGALVVTIAIACGGGKAQLNPEITPLEMDPAGARPVSKTTFVVADNQQQYLYGSSVWIRTALVDKYVGSAIRAPQLDLWNTGEVEPIRARASGTILVRNGKINNAKLSRQPPQFALVLK